MISVNTDTLFLNTKLCIHAIFESKLVFTDLCRTSAELISRLMVIQMMSTNNSEEGTELFINSLKLHGCLMSKDTLKIRKSRG